jgi:hypothetical protein
MTRTARAAFRSEADARARGAHLRLQALKLERRTADALRVANRVKDQITRNAERGSPEAYLRLRFDYDRARLLARREDEESLAEARRLFNDVYALVGFEANPPLIDGDRRLSLLSDLGTAISASLGEHERGALLAEQLLVIAESAGNDSRVQALLNSAGLRWRRHGYAEASAGNFETAKKALQRAQQLLARTLANEGRHLTDTDDATRDASTLIRESNTLLVRLELVVADDSSRALRARRSDLELLRADAESLVRRSEANRVVTPVELLHRYGRLGQVLVELARAASTNEDPVRRRATAVLARVFLHPLHALHRLDADEEPSVTIRYSDSCVLSGDERTAEETLVRGLRRLELRCGPEFGPCLRMRARLTDLAQTPQTG